MSADPATVTWLTGLAVDIEWGPSPFSAAPVLIVEPDGAVTLVVSEDEAPAVAEDVHVRTFPGFALEDVDRAGATIELALEALGARGPVAADLFSLPWRSSRWRRSGTAGSPMCATRCSTPAR